MILYYNMDLIIIFFAKYFIFVIAIAVGLYLLSFYGHTKHFYKKTFIIFGSALFSWVLAHVLKDIIKHPRPDEALAMIGDGTYSFPSGHTSLITTLGFLLLNINKKVGYTVMVFAFVVGLARVLAGVHYWYDIIGGFIFGLIVAIILDKVIKKFMVSGL